MAVQPPGNSVLGYDQRGTFHSSLVSPHTCLPSPAHCLTCVAWQATAAMWKTNGHKFKPHHDGLLVSYDKDDGEEKGGWSMRQRVEERQRKAEADLSRVLYRCAACTHFCFKLARPLSVLPERRTDGSRVVEAATDLVTMMAVKGGQKLLKREKGVERQFRYNCELCDACIAYRPVPYEQDCKYIYLFPEVSAGMSGSKI
ncbi:unnamed protein product [Closterium sp. Yama58-4]|nr:unnamed protein product [Closterium sp. Yama58-4]